MPRDCRRHEADQTLLLPPSLRGWLPEDHLAFFLSDAIDAMDLSKFEARYGDTGPGNQAFDPRMVLKVLVYAYATRTFSSRKIAAKLHEDVAFGVLGADKVPAHRTISDFRQRHLAEVRDTFVQVVQLARAKKTDSSEGKRYGRDKRGDELPEKLARREDRRRTIEAARKRLEARQRETDMDQIEENLGESPEKALADAGYRSESNFQGLEDRDIEGFVALDRKNKNGQTKEPNPSDEASVRMAKKMKSARGRARYRKRKYLAEPPFAWIKAVMGFRQFSLRGIDKVAGEWDLACLAMNLTWMHGKMEWA